MKKIDTETSSFRVLAMNEWTTLYRHFGIASFIRSFFLRFQVEEPDCKGKLEIKWKIIDE